MTVDLRLSESDKASGLWLRLCIHMEGRLEALRQRNDAPLNEIDTAALRGEIKCLKSLIRLGMARPDMTGGDQPPL